MKSSLDRFLETQCWFAPGFDVTFAELHERFLEWLPKGERSQWGTKDVSRHLDRETYHGRQNITMICDVSFTPVYPPEPRPEVIEQWRNHVRFIDQGIGYLFQYSDGSWERMKPTGLMTALGLSQVHPVEVCALKAAARENPISLSRLLDESTGKVPQ